ncbi:MAG: hypothetical protein QM500_17785 [Methylococcales bacterium]
MSSKNTPNKFRVEYKVQEGDNYAGGWGARTKTINDLSQLTGFKYIQSVTPLYVEEFKPLSPDAINEAIAAETARQDEERKQNNLDLAKTRLKDAENAVNPINS